MKNENEKWMGVKGFPNYEISNHGRIRNITTNNFLKPSRAYNSCRINLMLDSMNHYKHLAKLVMDHWGEKLDMSKSKVKRPTVKYIDGNCENLRPENLTWNYEWETKVKTECTSTRYKPKKRAYSVMDWSKLSKDVDAGFKASFKRRGMSLPYISKTYLCVPL